METGGVTRTVRIEDLRGCLHGAFERLGLPDDHAAGLAELLIDCELRGHDSHGAAMLEFLAGQYRDGILNPRPEIRVLSETDGALLLDGDQGGGSVAPERAMRWCIERARARKGMAVAGIRNWQFVVAAPYVHLAAAAGCVGFACANAPGYMAAPGGLTKTLGTNPFGYGIPAGRHGPIVLDVAATNSAALKIRLDAREGRQSPPGAILDREGRPTTEPNDFFAGGLLAPLGYPLAPHKGFGLALLVDALAGVLTGSGFALGVRKDGNGPGCTLWALDVEGFLPRAEFEARVDRQIEQVKSGDRMAGVEELFVPGERGQRRKARLLALGTVPLSDRSWVALGEPCAALGVALPEVLGGGAAV